MPLNTAEYYDPKTGRWNEIARMNQCRFGVGCAILDNYIFAVGGSDGTNLKSVERYDPETNKWTFVASMSTARYVNISWKIYIIINISCVRFCKDYFVWLLDFVLICLFD